MTQTISFKMKGTLYSKMQKFVFVGFEDFAESGFTPTQGTIDSNNPPKGGNHASISQ